jgi:hypothetical protein
LVCRADSKAGAANQAKGEEFLLGHVTQGGVRASLGLLSHRPFGTSVWLALLAQRAAYWKQWKRARNRRRQLIRFGIDPEEVSLLSTNRSFDGRVCGHHALRKVWRLPTLNHELSTIDYQPLGADPLTR